MSMYSRDHHNTIKQLSSSKKKLEFPVVMPQNEDLLNQTLGAQLAAVPAKEKRSNW